jgi:pimeloyl-ACP methyl ester carboxylesterase
MLQTIKSRPVLQQASLLRQRGSLHLTARSGSPRQRSPSPSARADNTRGLLGRLQSLRSRSRPAEIVPANFEVGAPGTANPFYLIHDLTGVTGHLLPVAQAMQTPCCIVRQAPTTPNQGSFADTIAYYCDVIESHQTTGPLHLGGYSRGGQFAHEAARVLELERGRSVRSIVSIDGGAYDRYILLEGTSLEMKQRRRAANGE